MKKTILVALLAIVSFSAVAGGASVTGTVDRECKATATDIKFDSVPYGEKDFTEAEFSVVLDCNSPGWTMIGTANAKPVRVAMQREGVKNGELEVSFPEATNQVIKVGMVSEGRSEFKIKARLSGIDGKPINKTGAFSVNGTFLYLIDDVADGFGKGTLITLVTEIKQKISGEVNGSCSISVIPGQPFALNRCKGVERTEITSNGDGTETIRTFNDKNQITGSKVVPESKAITNWTIRKSADSTPVLPLLNQKAGILYLNIQTETKQGE